MLTQRPPNPLMFPELFCDILDFFHPEVYPIDAQALFALARTCSAFLEPSLNRLWRKLYSLKPLIRCYTRIADVDNAVPPTSSQLVIVERYSYRIRELTVYDSASVRFLQCISLHPTCLFPNLMALRWGSPHLDNIPIVFIQQLLSPSLISLDATLAEADGATLLSFLDNYPRWCRNLKSVEFRCADRIHSNVIIQTLSRSICGHGTLENVALPIPIDEHALKYLSTLPTLKGLSITLSESLRPGKVNILPTDPLFCGAQLFQFSVWDLDLLIILLRPRDQIFHTFRLYHHGRETSKAVLGLLELVASRPHKHPLFEVTLSFRDVSHPMSMDRMAFEAIRYQLSYKTLQPLMSLTSLRELSIQWTDQFSLDDDELITLARCWPFLDVFYIYCGRGGYPPFSTKHVTLQGLLSLVRLCPRLHTVGLPIDARHVPDVKEGPPCETNFACLIVPESPIDEALPVAEFLFEHLPCITAVDARFLRPPGTDSEQIMTYERTWELVEKHLGKLHGIFVDTAESDSEVSDD